jgi:integrase
VDLFVTHQGYGTNTRDDAVWAVRKYLCYFEMLGHETLATVTVDDVQRFILKVASEVKTSTLHNLFLYLRHFHIFLKEIGEEAPDCVELFSHKVYREMPIQGYVTDEELEQILNVIDTSTEVGKRNRAIILLGATTGLRACDIIRLKLTDIDWRKGEIRIEQSKTNQAIRLPLLSEAGDAIQDYILNARPLSHCSELFLRCAAPRTVIENATAVGTMFKDYERRAGIVRQPFDGKGFHGLRRRLAKKLLVSGSSLTIVAQVLGQTDMHSALQYLALDTGNLKECALSFSGIPVERREFQ